MSAAKKTVYKKAPERRVVGERELIDAGISFKKWLTSALAGRGPALTGEVRGRQGPGWCGRAFTSPRSQKHDWAKCHCRP